jgi:hypothetical protein
VTRDDSTQVSLRLNSNDGQFDEDLRAKIGHSIGERKLAKEQQAHLGKSD